MARAVADELAEIRAETRELATSLGRLADITGDQIPGAILDLGGRISRLEESEQQREKRFADVLTARIVEALITKPQADGASDLNVSVGGKRVVFISASVRAALWWVAGRLLPWALALGGGGYLAHDQITAKDRQHQQRRIDDLRQQVPPPEPKLLREPRLEIPSKPPHP